MSGSLTSVPVVSLLTLCILYSVWTSAIGDEPLSADMEILLDSSTYIKEEDFVKIKEFLKFFVKDFDVGPKEVNMGLINFAVNPRIEFSLNTYTTGNSLLAAIDNIQYMGTGQAHMEEPLRLVRQEAFTKTSGDREDVPNILILVVDGRSASWDSARQEIDEIKKTDIIIFVVTFYEIVTYEMRLIASKDQNIFHVTDLDTLNNLHYNLAEAVSEEIAALLPQKPAPNTPPSITPATTPPSITPATTPPSNTPATTPPSNTPATTPPSNTSATTPPSNTSATTPPSNTSAAFYFHPQPPCVDSISSCAEYGFFHCNPDSLWAQYICREHCGVCAQHCHYKGQWYSEGAQWQDGCAYDCQCVDGATGHYQCYNKCPTYIFLPPSCTLVQLPGLCCLQPVCDFGAIYQNVENLNGSQVCVYNGTKYYQGQRWTVGCDTECFCYDAGIGLYTCHSKCAQYWMLPFNCRLVKKSDECCVNPECQFYTTMGPFTGVGQPSGNGQSVYTVFIF